MWFCTFNRVPFDFSCKLCLKRGIEEEINNNLEARGLMFINSRGHYVLTETGASFFNELTEKID